MVFVLIQRHTSELNDAVDWKRLNISSITEQSALDDFLATAELAGTEFTAGTDFRQYSTVFFMIKIKGTKLQRFGFILKLSSGKTK